MNQATKGPAQTRYDELEPIREPFLRRAREQAKYTIPSLIPPEGHNHTQEFEDPYQSLGARGVNNLAGRLVMTLFPPTSIFFRHVPDPQAVKEAGLDDEAVGQLDSDIAEMDNTIFREVETRNLRAPAFEAFKHLVVSGNVLVHVPEKGVRVFPLSQYVVKRDPEGNMLEAVVREEVSPTSLPEEIQERVAAELQRVGGKDAKTVAIYTHIRLVKNRWQVHQEVFDIVVPRTKGSYPKDRCPWVALRWTKIDNEDYGRAHCEEYIGDLRTYEGLSKALVEGAAAAARVLFLNSPNGTTSTRDLEEAPNLAVREGNKEDVTVLALDKFADFRVAKETLDKVGDELKFAFLLNSAIQREGERVTAEEIRYMANELENALGGVYSVQASEFQLPLINLLKLYLQKRRALPVIDEDVLKPVIVTGLDALGRSQELMRLDSFISNAVELLGPEEANTVLNLSTYFSLRQNYLGLPKGLVRSPEEQDSIRQRKAQQSMVEQAIPNAVKGVSDNMLAARQSQQEQQ